MADYVNFAPGKAKVRPAGPGGAGRGKNHAGRLIADGQTLSRMEALRLYTIFDEEQARFDRDR